MCPCVCVLSCSGAEVSDCGGYVLLTPSEGCEPVNRLYYVDLEVLGGAAGITGERCTASTDRGASSVEKGNIFES